MTGPDAPSVGSSRWPRILLIGATVGYLADRYVSGDKGVSLIGEAAVRALLTETFPGASLRSTNLIERDPPNYAVVCDLP